MTFSIFRPETAFRQVEDILDLARTRLEDEMRIVIEATLHTQGLLLFKSSAIPRRNAPWPARREAGPAAGPVPASLPGQPLLDWEDDGGSGEPVSSAPGKHVDGGLPEGRELVS